MERSTEDNSGKTLRNTSTFRWVILLLFILLSTGCVAISPSHDKLFEDQTKGMNPGETREVVLKKLGNPIISSRYMNFDIFCKTIKQTAIPWFIFPVGYQMDYIHEYTMVRYNSNDLVEDVQTGLYREPHILGPINKDHLYLNLRSGFLTLERMWGDRHVFLMVDSNVRDAFLGAIKDENKCLIVLGLVDLARYVRIADFSFNKGDNYCLPGFSIPSRHLHLFDPSRIPVEIAPVAAFLLPPGDHTLNFLNKWQYRVNCSTTFQCQKGQTKFLIVNVVTGELASYIPYRENIICSFDFNDKIPEVFLERPILMNVDGNWLVDPDSKAERGAKLE